MTSEKDNGRRRGERSTILIKKTTGDDEPLPPKGSRRTIWDRELKGFGVRIASSGAKTYLLRYRMGGRGTPIRPQQTVPHATTGCYLWHEMQTFACP